MRRRTLLLLPALLAARPASAELAGKLVSTGSDTLGALSSLWAQRLMRAHPALRVQIRAVGSSAAPTALIEGTADIGPMSRPMSAAEQAAFEGRFGYSATAVPVGVDTLAVLVHRNNPLRVLRREQLDSLFSANRRCGATALITRWADLGVSGSLGEQPVHRYGRDAASGTYGFFRSRLLCGGDYAPRVNRLVGSAAVVRAVATDSAAIGYASGGFVSGGVRALQILQDDGSAMDLSRDLLLYINREPGTALPDALRAYLREVLGDAGQGLVRAAGYTPLALPRRRALLAQLGLDS